VIRLWRSPTLRSAAVMGASGAGFAAANLMLPGSCPNAVGVWAAGFVIAAWYGWSILLRERHAKPDRTYAIAWGEALAFAGVNASGLLLIQLDRLIIPHVRPLEDLATFGVLAAIVGSLYRVLQQGVGYSLLPRLRAASGVAEQRRLLAHEAPSLIVAAIVAGVTKILNAFGKASVSALATPRELALVNYLGWASVVLAIAGGLAGGAWGLAGVIYGVALGWSLRAVAAFYVTARHLRLPVTVPAPTP